MLRAPKLKETRLAGELTELTSRGQLRWTLKTPAALSFSIPSLPMHLDYCYEARLGNKFLVLYDSPSDILNAMPGRGSLSQIGERYFLSVVDVGSRAEALLIFGRVLDDLYQTVRARTGDTDSILDDLLRTTSSLNSSLSTGRQQN